MKNTIRMAALSACILALGPVGSGLAQHAGHGGHAGHGSGDVSATSMPSVRSGKISGTVLSSDQSSITVQSIRKGESQKLIYLLDSRTKFKGDLEQGAEVTVKYLEQDGVRKASSVEVKKPKAGRKS